MATNSDVFPSQDGKFNDFQSDFITVVSTNHIAWGITPAEVTALTDAQAPWTAAWAVAKNKLNRTRAQITAKTQAGKAYKAVLRPFIKTRIYGNILMTPADIEACGLKKHSTSRTPVGAPVGTPLVTVAGGMGNGMAFYFTPPKAEDGSTKRAKPKGVSGLMVVMQYTGDKAPTDPKQCTDAQEILTRSPRRFSFPPETIGKLVYFYACWINPKGVKGPWTTLQQFVLT